MKVFYDRMSSMRSEFAEAIVNLSAQRSDLVFLTVDLGYMAIEPVAAALGERFINTGVAEQNTVALAAGLARAGHLPWVYSMASFTVLRPYAQIRDTVCLHRLPVKLVGNGGGYGYGIMGATHHALEDVGAMRALPNLRIYLPLLGKDIAPIVNTMSSDPLPNYLRLNRPANIPHDVPAFGTFRKIKPGRSCVVVGMGPVIEGLYLMGAQDILDELEIWSVGVLPFGDLPEELLQSIFEKGRVATMEEHYLPTGFSEAFSYQLLIRGFSPRYLSLCAQGYPSGRYGSQMWHQEESGLGGPKLRATLEKLLS